MCLGTMLCQVFSWVLGFSDQTSVVAFLKNNLKEVKDIPGKDTGSLYVLDVLLNICKNVHLVKKGT